MNSYTYIILIIILIISSFYYEKYKNTNLFYCCSFIVFCFIALRAPVVGADTLSYVRFFTGKQAFYSYTDNRDLEILFLFYNKIVNFFSNNGQIYIIVNSLISLAPIFYIIKKYSKNAILSIALFFLLNLFSVYFIALRQILAISFNIWAIIFIVEKRKYHWFYFILFSIISYYFHTSSIIVSIIYFISIKIQVRKRNIYIYGILISAIIGFYLSQDDYFHMLRYISGNALTDRLSGYSDAYEIEVQESFLSFIKVSIIGLYVFINLKTEDLNNIFSKIYFISIIIANIFYYFPLLYRANVGFEIFSIVVFTWSLNNQNIKNRLIAKLITFSIIFLLTFTFIKKNINIDLDDPGRLHPYYWFFENYNDHPSFRRF